jgi:coenzyme F420 biosynthesis associated uncharacterized protein
MPQLVDWDLAATLGIKTARRGPTVEIEQARSVVTGLRTAALRAVNPVREVTGLVAEREVPILVVDRASWIRANVATFQTVLEPVEESAPEPSSALVREVGQRLTAVEIGAVLGWLSGKVLGQYDLIGPADGPGAGIGRLLLVAPNVLAAEQAMGVDGNDFRLWVCLHEETHRVQFGAAPWLRSFLLDGVAELVSALAADPAQLLERIKNAASSLRGGGDADLLTVALTPEQMAQAERLVAVMSLLEGHADVVMDEVGPTVVPSVDQLRERMERRRSSPGAVDSVVRRLLGMDAKLRQYRDGARFVRAVVGRVGMSGFNVVWQGPEQVPTAAEIADPDLWVDRVHA